MRQVDFFAQAIEKPLRLIKARNAKGEHESSPVHLHKGSSLIFSRVVYRTGNTNRRCFIQAILLIEDRRRAQMQCTGHAKAEVAGPTLGLGRSVTTDMAKPGGSFHVVAATHAALFQSR